MTTVNELIVKLVSLSDKGLGDCEVIYTNEGLRVRHEKPDSTEAVKSAFNSTSGVYARLLNILKSPTK